MSETKYGETRIEGDVLRHVAGKVCGAIPRRSFEVPLGSIRLVAELLRPGRTLFDTYYVFAGGAPLALYGVPLESFGTEEELGVFFTALEKRLGEMHQRPSHQRKFSTSVLWPEALAGERLFEEVRLRRAGVIGKLLDVCVPNYRLRATPAIERALGSLPEWAE